jgi:hypothetical protein
MAPIVAATPRFGNESRYTNDSLMNFPFGSDEKTITIKTLKESLTGN